MKDLWKIWPSMSSELFQVRLLMTVDRKLQKAKDSDYVAPFLREYDQTASVKGWIASIQIDFMVPGKWLELCKGHGFGLGSSREFWSSWHGACKRIDLPASYSGYLPELLFSLYSHPLIHVYELLYTNVTHHTCFFFLRFFLFCWTIWDIFVWRERVGTLMELYVFLNVFCPWWFRTYFQQCFRRFWGLVDDFVLVSKLAAPKRGSFFFLCFVKRWRALVFAKSFKRNISWMDQIWNFFSLNSARRDLEEHHLKHLMWTWWASNSKDTALSHKNAGIRRDIEPRKRGYGLWCRSSFLRCLNACTTLYMLG